MPVFCSIARRRPSSRERRLRFFAWIGAAFVAAWLRELPRRNQAAAVAKLRGLRAGFRERLTDPPRL